MEQRHGGAGPGHLPRKVRDLPRRPRIRSTAGAVFVGVASAASACSSDGPSSASGTPAAEVVPGTAIHVVGSSELVARVLDVTPAGDSTVWVLNTAEPFFVQLGADGTTRASWGRRGGGPAEFTAPSALVTERRTGEVWVYDRGRHALVRVSGARESPDALALDPAATPPGSLLSFEGAGMGAQRIWLRSGEGGFLVARAPLRTAPGLRNWAAEVVEVDRAGDPRTFLDAAEALGDPSTRFGDATELLPYPMWAVCPDGGAALYDPLANRVRRFSSAGNEVEGLELPPERRREVDLDAVFRMVFPEARESTPAGSLPDSATLYRQLEDQWSEVEAQIPGVFPEYADLECVGRGSVWIDRFDPDAGRMGLGPAWLRVAPDGTTDEVRLPDGFRALRFDGDRIWGTVRDAYDVEAVAWLARPGA